MHCSLRNVVLNNAHDPLAVNTLITIICYENALFIFAKMLRNTLDQDFSRQIKPTYGILYHIHFVVTLHDDFFPQGRVESSHKCNTKYAFSKHFSSHCFTSALS